MLFLSLLALLFTGTEALSVCNSTGVSLNAASFKQSFSSPNHPNKYPNNRECLWNITASLGKIIRLEFEPFKVSGFTCSLGDYVEVRDGQVWQSAAVIGQYCDGNKPPTAIYSRSANVLVRFKSNDVIDEVGFQAEYKAVVPAFSCSGSSDGDKNILISNSSGVITSPNYPSNYKDNLDCVWKITTPNTNTAIKLEFNSVELAEPSGSSCENVDYLEVVDGFSYSLDGKSLIVIGKFCGNSDPGIIYSSGRSITIHFKTNGAAKAKGFSVNYSTIPLVSTGKCGEDLYLSLTGDGGTFYSAGYPLEYPKSTDCVWDILVPNGKRVLLTFYKFELQDDCSADYVEVFDGNTPGSAQIGQILCGKTVPNRFISTDKYMRVKFHSDTLHQKKGFLARFESTTKVSVEGICSPHITNDQSFVLTKLNGTIKSPNYPLPYPNNMNCFWIITAPNNLHVKLSFKNLTLQSSPECTKDYVELRNGGSASGALIGSYCSSVPPPRISSEKSMWVRFHSDESVRELGFEAYYEFTTEAPSSGSSLLTCLAMNLVFAVVIGVLSHN